MTAIIRPMIDEQVPSRLALTQRCSSCWQPVCLPPLLIDLMHQHFAHAQCDPLLDAVFLCERCEARCLAPDPKYQ